MMLDRLVPYFEGLTRKEKKLARRAIAHHILIEDYRKYCALIKELPSGALELFKTEVREYLKHSFESRCIWRAVYASISVNDLAISQAASKFNVSLRDIAFLWNALEGEDREKIRELSQKESSWEFLSPQEMSKLVSDVNRHIGKVSYFKLRFIKDNDNGVSQEDLAAELMRQAMYVIRRYEHTGNVALVRNYAKQAVSNHAINLIHHHTSESRSKVQNNTTGCGTCIYCLSQKPQRCYHDVATYRVRNFSLDSSVDQGDTTEYSPAPTLPCDDISVEEKVSNQEYLDTLRQQLSSNAARMVNVVTGGYDNDFEGWLSDSYEASVEDYSSNPRKLVKAFSEYIGSGDELIHEIQRRFRALEQVAL